MLSVFSAHCSGIISCSPTWTRGWYT